MAFESGTDEVTCPDCGTVHQAKWERLPVREHQTLRCCKCSAVMFSGRTVHDYTDLIVR